MAQPAISPPCRQLLFVLDTSERTGASWQLLHRACLAILNVCWNRQATGSQPTETGIMLLRDASTGAQCTLSRFTTDYITMRRWLMNVIFDGGPGSPALLEGLLTVADGDWWRPEPTARHVVLVTHGEPRALPALSSLKRARRAWVRYDSAKGMPCSRPNCWSPVPEALASAGIALSVVSPRKLPRLYHLQVTACEAMGAEMTPPRDFSEAPELYLSSPLMHSALPSSLLSSRPPSELAHRRPGSSSDYERTGPSTLPSPTGARADPWQRAAHAAPPTARPRPPSASPAEEANPGAGLKATARACARASARGLLNASSHAPAERAQHSASPLPLSANDGSFDEDDAELCSALPMCCDTPLWSGRLAVEIPVHGNLRLDDLGTAQLLVDSTVGSAARWTSAAAGWVRTLTLRQRSFLDGTARQNVLHEISRDRERGADGCALQLKLVATKRKAGELLDTLRREGRWAKLELPGSAFAVYLDPTEPGDIRGWLLHDGAEELGDSAGDGALGRPKGEQLGPVALSLTSRPMPASAALRNDQLRGAQRGSRDPASLDSRGAIQSVLTPGVEPCNSSPCAWSCHTSPSAVTKPVGELTPRFAFPSCASAPPLPSAFMPGPPTKEHISTAAAHSKSKSSMAHMRSADLAREHSIGPQANGCISHADQVAATETIRASGRQSPELALPSAAKRVRLSTSGSHLARPETISKPGLANTTMPSGFKNGAVLTATRATISRPNVHCGSYGAASASKDATPSTFTSGGAIACSSRTNTTLASTDNRAPSSSTSAEFQAKVAGMSDADYKSFASRFKGQSRELIDALRHRVK